jgi:hypothetical protein
MVTGTAHDLVNIYIYLSIDTQGRGVGGGTCPGEVEYIINLATATEHVAGGVALGGLVTNYVLGQELFSCCYRNQSKHQGEHQ